MTENNVVAKDPEQHVSVIFYGQMAYFPDLVYHWTASCDKDFCYDCSSPRVSMYHIPSVFRKHYCKDSRTAINK